ncbi:MAG: acyl-ACP--UDP-N-acetylglucosamine O-acyltransferase [Vampirovibrionia bacterium]
MERIHSTAIVDPAAEIAEDVIIGPFSIVGPNVILKSGTILESRVVIDGHTEIGHNCKIAVGAVVGTPPQDLSYKNEPTKVIIGDNTVLREYVTVNRASGEGNSTIVGSDCMIMAYTHIAHNCVIGNKVIMANYAGLAGHVEVGDSAFIGGITAIHQFVKIGKYAIISGFSGTRQDIPPFSMTDGRPAIVRGVNKVGLRRNGFTREEIDNLRKAFRIIWFEKHNLTNALELIQTEVNIDEHIKHLIDFIQNSKRGVIIKQDQDL